MAQQWMAQQGSVVGGLHGDSAVPGCAESTERRKALQGVAKLFGAPETLGVPRGTALISPHGFDIHSAKFDPAALKRPRSSQAVSRASFPSRSHSTGTWRMPGTTQSQTQLS
mmetsp:Transcript_28003/g.65377  ORF Transcript_28003/g.65377 Transcript_28003/m.65377 type:complete len:112 (-) Transcript_28003:129-464(-)